MAVTVISAIIIGVSNYRSVAVTDSWQFVFKGVSNYRHTTVTVDLRIVCVIVCLEINKPI